MFNASHFIGVFERFLSGVGALGVAEIGAHKLVIMRDDVLIAKAGTVEKKPFRA